MKRRTALGFLPILLLSPAAHAAEIKFVGTAKDTPTLPQVTDWRTPDPAKTMLLKEAKSYGEMGSVNWFVGSSGENKTEDLETFGWIFGGPSAVMQTRGDGSITVNHPKNPGQQVPAGTITKKMTFRLSGTPEDYAGKVVRIGIMQDVLPEDQRANDTFKGLQIVGAPDTGGDSDVEPVRNGAAGTGTPEMYFFDIFDVKPGDSFTITALTDVGGSSGNEGYLGPVSFDVGPAPAQH